MTYLHSYVKNNLSTQYTRFSSGQQITGLWLGYEKTLIKTSCDSSGGVQDESFM